jgi:hypothetical protein
MGHQQKHPSIFQLVEHLCGHVLAGPTINMCSDDIHKSTRKIM